MLDFKTNPVGVLFSCACKRFLFFFSINFHRCWPSSIMQDITVLIVGHCRKIKFKEQMENKALRNHVIKSLQEIDVDNCELQCYLEPNCVSYNYGPSLCELNDMTHLQAPLDDMEARDGSTYRAIFYVSNMVEPGVLYHIGSIQTTFEFYY